jgi:nicotinamide mononucleotide transporter
MDGSFVQSLWNDLLQTGWVEFTAVAAGIFSVWLSRIENIWVFPVGLISTIIYIFLSWKAGLPGEALVNVFYTVMSVYGWYIWMRPVGKEQTKLPIVFSSAREWVFHFVFFVLLFAVLYFLISNSGKWFSGGVLPFADSFATASAFTGMLLMAQKRVESWIWWIITDAASVPLYYTKGFAFSSVFYFVLLIMAIDGWFAWRKKAM